jgi:serine/threonine protein kinase
MTEKKFQRFGKYLILDHLVDGGMAKICRARYLGEQANKVVAIKMVQPQFSNDEAFVRMFQDELNITFGMLHPNIMQVYDYGKTNDQLYTAMEYIHGANLKQYLDRLKEKKVVFPVEISCYIISQVCLGLHYAHTFTDKLTGKPYNIVHRDISPHNIMLTYDGAVKVIDFGIAKANTNSEATQAGTIKGKLSYLAPEYLDGHELDARYDEFAVGVTLWELLCSRKLFQANNDLAVLKLIQACKITPPSEINPLVPKELDAIVMKALSKDRNDRYENLDQMNRALVKFLYSTYPEFNASDLKMFADDLFKAEIIKDQHKFVEYGKLDINLYISDLKREEHQPEAKAPAKPVPSAKPGEVRTTVREIELQVDKAQPTGIGLESNQGRHDTRKTHRDRLTSKPYAKSPTKISQSSSTKDLKSEKAGGGSTTLIASLIVASLVAVAYLKADLFLGTETAVEHHASRKVSSVPGGQKAEAKTSGEVIFSGVDMAMEIYVNNVRTEYVGVPVKVGLNEEVTIVVKKQGYQSFTTSVSLDSSKNSTVVAVPSLQKARMGILTTSMNYTAGSQLVYEDAGEKITRDLPFKDVEFPEGSYQAKIVNPILGTEKRVEFTIEESKKHFLE